MIGIAASKIRTPEEFQRQILTRLINHNCQNFLFSHWSSNLFSGHFSLMVEDLYQRLDSSLPLVPQQWQPKVKKGWSSSLQQHIVRYNFRFVFSRPWSLRAAKTSSLRCPSLFFSRFPFSPPFLSFSLFLLFRFSHFIFCPSPFLSFSQSNKSEMETSQRAERLEVLRKTKEDLISKSNVWTLWGRLLDY